MRNQKKFLREVYHIIVGFILTLKGLDKLGHSKLIGGIILFFGLFLLIYFIVLIIKKSESKKRNIVIHLFEGIALLFISYIFYSEGKTLIPFITLIASIGFFITVIIHFPKKLP